MNAGNVFTVGEYAEQLRLHITQDECSPVLDHLAEQKMVVVTLDHVERAINELFEDRFHRTVAGKEDWLVPVLLFSLECCCSVLRKISLSKLQVF